MTNRRSPGVPPRRSTSSPRGAKPISRASSTRRSSRSPRRSKGGWRRRNSSGSMAPVWGSDIRRHSMPPRNYSKVEGMSDDDKVPEGVTPEHVRDRMRSIAARLREAAENLGGEVMIELPSRLGDHEGLLLALANELEQLVK